MRSPDRASSVADAAQHFGQLRARHDAVLHVVVRRDAAHRGERGLAAFPDPLALRRRCARSRSSVAPARAAHRFDAVANSSSTSTCGPSSSTIRTASAVGNSGCTAASAASIVSRSIISTAAGTMPAPMIAETAAAGRVDRIERREQRLHRLGPRSRRSVAFVTIAERSFRSDEERRADRARAHRAPRRRGAPARRWAARLRRRARDGR